MASQTTTCPVSILTRKCIGCLNCVRTCPQKVLEMVNFKSAVVHPECCIACGECCSVCPPGAILFHKQAAPQLASRSPLPLTRLVPLPLVSPPLPLPLPILKSSIESARFALPSALPTPPSVTITSTPDFPQVVVLEPSPDFTPFTVDRFYATLSLLLAERGYGSQPTRTTATTQSMPALAVGLAC